jgi:hypothetical protein
MISIRWILRDCRFNPNTYIGLCEKSVFRLNFTKKHRI